MSRDFVVQRIDHVIGKNPDLITSFNQAVTNTTDRYPSVNITVDESTMIYSVYSKESNMIIGFFTLDDFSADDEIIKIQVVVHPSSCKLSYIKIFNVASFVCKKLNPPVKAYVIFSELPSLGLYAARSSAFADNFRLFNIYQHLPESGSYMYSIPNTFRVGMSALGDDPEYLTVRYN